MQDYIFVILAIFSTTALTYFAYKLLWGIGGKNIELQITSEEIIQQIKILLSQKKHDIIEKLAKNYLKNKPQDYEVRILLAKSYFDNNNYNEAIENIKFVIKYQPKNTEYKIFLANCYRILKKPNLAIETFLAVLDYDETNYWVMKNVAILYMETNQKFSAIKMYEKMLNIIEDVNDKVDTKMILADLYSSVNENEKAIKHYLEILEIYPDDLLTKMILCETYEKSENYDEMVKVANDIIKHAMEAKDSLWALYKLLSVSLIKKNYEKAFEIAKAINENPVSDKVRARDDLAQILVEMNRIDESISVWNDLIEEVPTNIDLKRNLATAYLKNSDYETAVMIYEKIMDNVDLSEITAINQELSVIYSNWGMCLFNKGDQDGCFEKFNAALKYDSENPVLYWKLGCIDKAINNFKEALCNFKKALELDSENVQYYYEIAECYEAMENAYEQRKYLSESLNYNNSNSQIYYKLSLSYQQQNDWNSAVTYMERSVELDPNFVDAKLKLALMYEHAGKVDAATLLYEAILKLEPEHEEAINNLHMLGS